jgi:hypothetical protein
MNYGGSHVFSACILGRPCARRGMRLGVAQRRRAETPPPLRFGAALFTIVARREISPNVGPAKSGLRSINKKGRLRGPSLAN